MISIVVPAYNREKIIVNTLKSIQQQSFQDWECLVVDDSSLDNTHEVVRDFIKNDARFLILSNNRKKGAQGARNTGVLASKGEYIVFFDSDDQMHPDFLEKVYRKINDDNTDICGSFLSLIDTSGNTIGAVTWKGYGYLHGDLIRGKTYFCNDSTLIRKQKLLDIGLLDEDCPSYQEWETHIRLSKISTYTTVEEKLVDYYRGGEDTISKNNSRAVKGFLYIINKNRKDFLFKYPLTLLRKSVWVYSMIQQEKNEGREYESLIAEFKSTIPYPFRLASQIISRHISH